MQGSWRSGLSWCLLRLGSLWAPSLLTTSPRIENLILKIGGFPQARRSRIKTVCVWVPRILLRSKSFSSHIRACGHSNCLGSLLSHLLFTLSPDVRSMELSLTFGLSSHRGLGVGGIEKRIAVMRQNDALLIKSLCLLRRRLLKGLGARVAFWRSRFLRKG